MAVLFGAGYLCVRMVSVWFAGRFERGDDEDGEPTATPQRPPERSRARGASRSSTPTTVVCSNCGAENERGYTFCRRCVNPIAAPGDGGATSVP